MNSSAEPVDHNTRPTQLKEEKGGEFGDEEEKERGETMAAARQVKFIQ